MAEWQKGARYGDLAQRHLFVLLMIKTMGTLGPSFAKLFQKIGRRITEQTGEAHETWWLQQRIRLAVVRRNAAAITTGLQEPTHNTVHTHIHFCPRHRLTITAVCRKAGAATITLSLWGGGNFFHLF